MVWIFRHKLLMLAVTVGVAYWLLNPAGRFGIVRKGFVVYSRIPVLFFDCYIGPEGKLTIEEDLSLKSNQTYWFENHFSNSHNNGTDLIPLLVGTGFDDGENVTFDRALLKKIRDRGFEPHFYPSREAIARYDALRDEGKTTALLLKIK